MSGSSESDWANFGEVGSYHRLAVCRITHLGDYQWKQ